MVSTGAALALALPNTIEDPSRAAAIKDLIFINTFPPIHYILRNTFPLNIIFYKMSMKKKR
ncbi:hypothetical protein GCM10008014_00260 [Paenibacillus silvae]|uniref:Uncharacterized protein n=1 Tax=Paenibacillus silvae TaxID=1325358 RepID=A0ABQ1YW46_9BACL|nr:hypothetical protein GCM10008014_00260 [Paenibacillus silvae]